MHANSPGMPSADDSISTTRITLPSKLPNDLQKVNLAHLRTEDPHWPLIFMTVLTQLSVGAFTAIWFMHVFGTGAHRVAAVVALTIAFAALSASTLHLGRPIHAARALKMWRRSWLSREVLMFTLFASAATLYSGLLFFGFGSASILGALTVLFGIAGVGASARLYLAPGRPAWNSPLTIAEFFATATVLGFAGANVLNGGSATSETGVLIAGLGTVMVLATKVARLALASRYELYASWQLLSTVLFNKLALRGVLLAAGVCFSGLGQSTWMHIAGVVLILAGEFVSRYLFFVSVVASNIASGYLAQEAA